MDRQQAEADAQSVELLGRADRLIQLLEHRREERGVDVKVDTHVDNRRPERAAWICGIACAVCFTIAITQAFQIHSLQRAHETLQGKYDRMQDYLNYIYQQAPSLRKPEPSK